MKHKIISVVLAASFASAGGFALTAAPAAALDGHSGSVADPAGDNGPGGDPRGDIIGVEAKFEHWGLVLNATFAGDVHSGSWSSHYDGNPNYSAPNQLDFVIDVDGDLDPDHGVTVDRPVGGYRVEIYDYETGDVLQCAGRVEFLYGWDVMTVSVGPACIGNPRSVRVAAQIYFETDATPPNDVSEDASDWTSAARPNIPDGYWMLGGGGAVYAFGEVAHHGNGGPGAVDIEPVHYGSWYWTLHRDGRVTPPSYLGDAQGLLDVGESAVSISATRSGGGYWIFTDRGRVLEFGDADFFGDLEGYRLNGPILDSIPTTSGHGYYMVGSDGGVFAFGDAAFYGSMGGHRLNAPVMSLVPDNDGMGYWLVAYDGGIFAFDAPFRGSMGGVRLNRPVTGMVRHGDGYLMVGEDGGIFNFSTSPFYGSLGNTPPAVPIVAVASSG